MHTLVNSVTSNLAQYPMEQLKAISKDLFDAGRVVYDFGTGDPRLKLWSKITETLKNSVSEYSSYPSISGSQDLVDSQFAYLKRRFSIERNHKISVLPTRGSKEAIFHIALSLVGRGKNKRKILFPNPGYPVYYSSALFAGGLPVPITLEAKNNYQLEPWNLPKETLEGVCALWVNYPHNPTGAIVNESYWQKLIEWCHIEDVILLSDECYSDLYYEDKKGQKFLPSSPLQFSSDKVLSFHSLSKRSGLTGIRSGFIAGDAAILDLHKKARANFGLSQPEFIQKASVVAWGDDEHVKKRRNIFNSRIDFASQMMKEFISDWEPPRATFYLWVKIPNKFKDDDVKFCMELAKHGFISTPSSWLGNRIKGYFRISLSEDKPKMAEAFSKLGVFFKS